jgi:DNA polymerase-3 subunit delta
MIIFLYGPDTYRSRQKLNEIIEHYKKIHQRGLSLKFFGEENLDFQDFKDVLNSTSMFEEKKLIVLKEIFSNPVFKEEFLKQKERLAKVDDLILIYEKKEIPANDPLLRFLKKNSKFQEFELLEGEKFKNWIKREFLKYKTEIEPQALEKLIESVGNNLWQMENEIKKLVSYKIGHKKTAVAGKICQIGKREVELLVKPKTETDIFRTIGALAEKKKNLALNLIHKHLEKGDSPLYLLKMINFQFRNLLIVRSQSLNDIRMIRINDLSKKLGMHPYVLRKTIWQAGKFTIGELKKIYQKIFEVDLAIKSGKVKPETALDLLIAEI